MDFRSAFSAVVMAGLLVGCSSNQEVSSGPETEAEIEAPEQSNQEDAAIEPAPPAPQTGAWECVETEDEVGAPVFDCSYIEIGEVVGWGLTFRCDSGRGSLNHVLQAVRASDGSDVLWDKNGDSILTVSLDGGPAEEWGTAIAPQGDNLLQLMVYETGDELDLYAIQNKSSWEFISRVPGSETMFFSVPDDQGAVLEGTISMTGLAESVEEIEGRGCLK